MSAWLSWSCRKDGACALGVSADVTGLFTTVTAGRVPVHGVRQQLVEAQAAALGLPLHVVELPWPCPNAEYERRTGAALAAARAAGADTVVYGDLFLDDIRAYRERTLAGTGLTPRFPLWGRPTGPLARDMIAAGLRAVVVSVDPTRMPADLAGHAFDEEFLAALPAGVDPCGENGEFHTFVTDGPGFRAPVPVTVDGVVDRDGMTVAELVPGISRAAR
ncbi:ATP-binding protein [Pseudonocardia kujensis]|uniref:Dph6-related ATP pyrophosphatase n=1 Tax=Pseudonocardia kujensis TaxID=1128675 RepID=UPI001E5BFBD5|nr:ATP-binding protein [Pseudonocardia kujensis]MCE0765698.1 ATP-binding protein [Pseudonocardia kujensis]